MIHCIGMITHRQARNQSGCWSSHERVLGACARLCWQLPLLVRGGCGSGPGLCSPFCWPFAAVHSAPSLHIASWVPSTTRSAAWQASQMRHLEQREQGEVPIKNRNNISKLKKATISCTKLLTAALRIAKRYSSTVKFWAGTIEWSCLRYTSSKMYLILAPPSL